MVYITPMPLIWYKYFGHFETPSYCARYFKTTKNGRGNVGWVCMNLALLLSKDDYFSERFIIKIPMTNSDRASGVFPRQHIYWALPKDLNLWTHEHWVHFTIVLTSVTLWHLFSKFENLFEVCQNGKETFWDG